MTVFRYRSLTDLRSWLAFFFFIATYAAFDPIETAIHRPVAKALGLHMTQGGTMMPGSYGVLMIIRLALDLLVVAGTRRGPEHDLLPWLADRGMPAMAYSPVEQGRLAANSALAAVADSIGATPTQVALAWTLRRDGVIAIPKAGTAAHVKENRAAAELELSADALAALDAAFPRPRARRALEML